MLLKHVFCAMKPGFGFGPHLALPSALTLQTWTSLAVSLTLPLFVLWGLILQGLYSPSPQPQRLEPIKMCGIHLHTQTSTYLDNEVFKPSSLSKEGLWCLGHPKPMRIYIHIPTHTYTYTFTYIYIHTYTYIHIPTDIYLYIHIHMLYFYTHMYPSIWIIQLANTFVPRGRQAPEALQRQILHRGNPGTHGSLVLRNPEPWADPKK